MNIEDIFGIETKTPELYKQALTHTSYIQDNNLPYNECYERLEFLGDAVLKLTVSDILFKKFPQAHEGQISKIRSIVVSDNTLADITKNNGLQNLIILSGHTEKQGCRNLNSICACAFEAVLGAYYLDGKFYEIRDYIEKTLTPYIEKAQNHPENYNAKEVLQEYTQGLTKTRPEYTVIKESGPDHKKVFEIEVSYNGEVLAIGKGSTKKEAEQKSAFEACKRLGII
ncbi:ribonuclease III [bacterium]|nr:ribonuclease III [bacterium]